MLGIVGLSSRKPVGSPAQENCVPSDAGCWKNCLISTICKFANPGNIFGSNSDPRMSKLPPLYQHFSTAFLEKAGL